MTTQIQLSRLCSLQVERITAHCSHDYPNNNNNNNNNNFSQTLLPHLTYTIQQRLKQAPTESSTELRTQSSRSPRCASPISYQPSLSSPSHSPQSPPSQLGNRSTKPQHLPTSNRRGKQPPLRLRLLPRRLRKLHQPPHQPPRPRRRLRQFCSRPSRA